MRSRPARTSHVGVARCELCTGAMLPRRETQWTPTLDDCFVRLTDTLGKAGADVMGACRDVRRHATFTFSDDVRRFVLRPAAGTVFPVPACSRLHASRVQRPAQLWPLSAPLGDKILAPTRRQRRPPQENAKIYQEPVQTQQGRRARAFGAEPPDSRSLLIGHFLDPKLRKVAGGGQGATQPRLLPVLRGGKQQS